MFTKINVSGITITSTLTNGETTTMKIDSINFEDNCSATEAIKVLEALPKILNYKQKKNKAERYHVFLSERWDTKNNPIHDKWIYDRKDHKYIHVDMYGHKNICGKAKYNQIARAYYVKERIEGLDVIESYDTDF